MAELGLSRVFELRGDLGAALHHARLAQEAAPNDPATPFIVGRILAALGATDEAITALVRARELAPKEPGPSLLAALVLRDAGRFERAADLLEEVWAEGVRSPAIAEQIGALNLVLDRPARTAEIARKMLQGDPNRPTFQHLLGLALARDPETSGDAIAALEAALRLGAPDPGRAYLELGTLFSGAGDQEAALAALRQAEELRAGDPEVYYRMGAAHRLAGNQQEAESAPERFRELRAQLDDNGSEAQRLRAELNSARELANAGRLEEALGKLDEILAAAPDNALAHATRAKVVCSLGSSRDALKNIVRARHIDPGRAENYLLEGVFLLDLKRFSEAETVLRKALALEPDLDQAHVMLAGSLAKQRRNEEAAEHFAKALELGADTPPLRLGYAAVLEALGRSAESEEQLEAYRQLKRNGAVSTLEDSGEK